MFRFNPKLKFQGVENYYLFMSTLILVQWQMSFLFQVRTATVVTNCFWHVFAIFERDPTLGSSSLVIFSGGMSSIIFARTRKQSNVYVLLVYAKNLNFALFAEVQPIATVVSLSTTDSDRVRSQHRFLLEILFFTTVFVSLELLATLMEAGSDSDNVIIRAPVPLPFLNTKRKWKNNNEKKQHKLQKIALLKILNVLS